MTDLIKKIIDNEPEDPVELLADECDAGRVRAYLIKDEKDYSVFFFAGVEKQEFTIIRFEYSAKSRLDSCIVKIAGISAELLRQYMLEGGDRHYELSDAIVMAEDSAELCSAVKNCISFDKIEVGEDGYAKTRILANRFHAIMARM